MDAEVRKDEDLAKKLGFSDQIWNFRAQFNDLHINPLPVNNKFFNQEAIEAYLNKAFEVKELVPKREVLLPHMRKLPTLKKASNSLEPSKRFNQTMYGGAGDVDTGIFLNTQVVVEDMKP